MAEDSHAEPRSADIERCKGQIDDALTMLERVETALEDDDENKQLLRLTRNFLWVNVKFLAAAYTYEVAQLRYNMAVLEDELDRLRGPGDPPSTVHLLNG